jgi:hypothetical protein
MRERRCFVQFIHPGAEHTPDIGELKRWNRDDHRRKFMKGMGRYIVSGEMKEGELVFWGEWEPESAVLHRYHRPVADRPRYLYEPYFVEHRDGAWRQNTDPFVFGERFHYTGATHPSRRYSASLACTRLDRAVRLLSSKVTLRARHRLRRRRPRRP